jgi:hypothetical protein
MRTTLILACLLVPLAARAADPKWQYGKLEEVKKIEWKASAQGGLILTTGNSNFISFSASGNGSFNDGKNRVTLDVGGAYAKSTLIVAADANMSGFLDRDEIQRIEKTTTALWNLKLRYDRFFTPNNLGYIAAFAFGNEPAGKTVVGGVQIGYSRQLFKNDMHLIVAEIGYDYSFERLTAPNQPDFHLHSLRLFAGYALTLTPDIGLGTDIEYLGTMNPFDGPYGKPVESFEDSRINARAFLAAKLYKNISFRFSFTARFDNVPAPLPPLGKPFAPGFVPPAEKLDTLSEAALVINFL